MFSHYAKKNCPDDGAKLPTLCLADGSAPGSEEATEVSETWLAYLPHWGCMVHGASVVYLHFQLYFKAVQPRLLNIVGLKCARVFSTFMLAR